MSINAWGNAWIIGASSGIGRELVLQLTSQCETVCVSARSKDKLDQLVAEHANVHAYEMDVTDSDAVLTAFNQIQAEHQTPDLIVISSGQWDQVEIPNFDPTIFQKGIDVNYMGVIHVLNASAKPMVDRGSGHLAIVSSVSGYRGLPNAAAYSPTKAALINLAESISPQLQASGVTVSIVNPGFVDTPMTSTNEFPMPFIISAHEAASRIIEGLAAKRFEIAFPRKLAWTLKLLRIMPNALFFWIVKKFILRN